MKPVSRTVRVVVSDHGHAGRLPHHPSSYEISDPHEVREVVAAVARSPRTARADFVCMCREEPTLTLFEGAGRRIRDVHGRWPELLDPAVPHTIPRRHRTAWAAAAPEPLRQYAEGLAGGDDPAPGAEPSVPPALVLSWLGASRADGDAARLLARRAPLALLEATPTEELAWAVRETDAAGLDGAVEFFASEGFTTRHPKKRRVGTTALELLLRHARRHRPDCLPVLERRVLRAAEDRISR
ncbi:hypothetical protein ACFPM3_03750 [Streptomyces coeruleoprunus]|uniref:Uncharacterized protein n=1 Tax=Streptomyces coeruleoprunus TaxID=285563 RepID=A0ABV9XAM7_9ACTN